MKRPRSNQTHFTLDYVDQLRELIEMQLANYGTYSRHSRINLMRDPSAFPFQLYKRLAPSVLEELRRRIPRDDKRRLKKKLFQGLTPDYGHPKVRELLAGETMLAKYSRDLETFMARVDLEYPNTDKQ
jgi:hypothetical protein